MRIKERERYTRKNPNGSFGIPMARGNFYVRTQAEGSYVGDFAPLLASVHKMNVYLSGEEVGILERMLEDCKRRKREYALETE